MSPVPPWIDSRAVPVRKYLPFPILLLMGIAPVLLAIIAGGIGEALGYEMHEGMPPPQSDFHAILLRLGVCGWYVLVTLPAAVLLSLLWLGILIVMDRRARAKTS